MSTAPVVVNISSCVTVAEVSSMAESFEDRLQTGKVAYMTKNKDGSYTVSWITAEGRKQKTMFGGFKTHNWARKHFEEIING